MKLKNIFLLIAILASFLLVGCDSDQGTEDKAEAPAKSAKDGKVELNIPPEDVAAMPKGPIEFSGSHILIPYKGAMRAPADITRTKEEALKLATDLAAKVAKDPTKLEIYAKKHSSCPTGATGGDLGTWVKGQMVPEFDVAIEGLKVGQATDKPIETAFGYHVIRRNKGMEKIEVAAQQIMIQYKGSMAAEKRITRSKDDAKKIAEQVAKEAQASPAQFKEIAKKFNDIPTAKLPIWTTGGRMPKEFDQAVLSLKIDQISDPVESPFGFHIFQRIKVVHRPEMSASHLMIVYKGARRAPETITRTKEEARKIATELLAQAKKDPAKFKELVLQNSEDPGATLNGGNLGIWEEGDMLPQFEEVLTKLKIGEVGGPVESQNGIHILKREEPIQQKPQMNLKPAPPK